MFRSPLLAGFAAALISAGMLLMAAPRPEPVIQISPWDVDLLPGGTCQFTLIESSLNWEAPSPAKAKARWSVTPDNGSVVIDPDTGLARVSGKTAPGSRYVVKASIEGKTKEIKTSLFVYDPANFFVGRWTQTSEIDCDSGKEVIPKVPLEELSFDARGGFKATWQPFEVYHDYWGSYKVDLHARTITIQIGGGNYIPKDVVTRGTFSTTPSDPAVDSYGRSTGEITITFRGLWLGRPARDHSKAGCGMVFKRVGR